MSNTEELLRQIQSQKQWLEKQNPLNVNNYNSEYDFDVKIGSLKGKSDQLLKEGAIFDPKKSSEKAEADALAGYLERAKSAFKSNETQRTVYEPYRQAADFAQLSAQIKDPKDSLSKSIAEGTGDSVFMDEVGNEKAMYTYLYNKYGAEQAKEYWDTIAPFVNQREAAKQQEDAKAFAEKAGIGASIVSLGSNLVDGVVMAPAKLIASLTGDYEKNWADYDYFTNTTGGIRQTRGEAWDKAFGTEDSDAGSFVYQTLMSIGDMATAIAISKGVGAIAGTASKAANVSSIVKGVSQFIMSSEAASNAMTSAREQGLTGLQTAGVGVASAAIEALTEKYSLDALLDKPIKNLWSHVGKNVLTEASEEAASNVLNILADEVIAGNQSKIKQEISSLMANGASYKDAAQEVLLGKLKEVGLDALGGALSGGIMGGGSAAIDLLVNVHYSVPKSNNTSLESAQNWVLEKLSQTKNTTKKTGLGDVKVDINSVKAAVSQTKNADQALSLLALNDIVRKGQLVEGKGGTTAGIFSLPSLNGNMHEATVALQKRKDGAYEVTGLTIDGETVYDASEYAKQTEERAAGASNTIQDRKNSAPTVGGLTQSENDVNTRFVQGGGTEENPQYSVVDGFEQEIVDLTDDNELSKKVKGVFGSEKYERIRDHILESLEGTPLKFKDGVEADVDRSDALHIANKAANKKVAQIAQLKRLVETAEPYAEDNNVLHNKFNYFRYYRAMVKYGDETYPIYLNVGKAKNDNSYHLYDVTQKLRDTAGRIYGLERPKPNEGYALLNDVSNNRLAQEQPTVNTQSMQNSLQNSTDDVLESRSYDYTESAEKWKADSLNEGSSGEITSIDEIVADIGKAFDVPINKGNIRQRKAAGIFKTRVNAIRTQLGNALPTICHELGHLLDKNHKLTSLPSINEAVKVMQTRDPEFSSLYAENKQKGEAVAEFVREYMRDRAAAKKQYPHFFGEFVNALGEDLGKLNAVSDKVNAYMYSSVSERIAANTTNRAEARKQKGGFAERFQTALDKAKKLFADDVDAIKQVSEKAYKAVFSARKAPTVTDYVLTEGMVDIDGNAVEGWENIGLSRVLAPVIDKNNNNYESFRTYLTLKRALDLLEKGIPTFRNGDRNLTDPVQIQREIDKLEAEYPVFKETAEQLYAWQRQFYQTWYVDTGMMSQEAYDEMWKNHPHYVPFNRNINKEISRSGKSSLANQDAGIKKIKGSSEQLLDPIENIVIRAAATVQSGKRNRIMQVLALEVEKGGIDSTVLEKISETKANAIQEALEKQNRVTEGDTETKHDPLENVNLVEWTGKANKENVVWAMINGERVLYEVHDKQLLDALLSSTPKQADLVVSFLKKAGGAFKSLTTGSNLIWSLTSNSFRDFATGYAFGSEGNIFKYTADYARAVKDVATNSERYQEARAAGLGYNSRISQPKELARIMAQLGQTQQGRSALRNAFSSMIEGIQKISEAVEAAPRMAEYSRAIEQGKSKTDAVYEASEVTLNFDRSGSISKKIDLAYPFFNVQIQGLYKQASMLADPEKRTSFIRRKVTSAFITALFVLAANAVLGGKDEYEKLSDYVKNNYYCFYIGNGKFLRIPKARELDVLESSIERVGEAIAYGNDVGDSFNDFAEYVFQAYAPLGFPDITALFEKSGKDKLVGFLKPTVTDLLFLGSVGEVFLNENYAGSPIVPAQYEDLVAKEQYDNKTSAVAKWLGSITGMSPMKLDHLIVSNAGFVGKLIKAYTANDIDWTGGYGNQFTSDIAYSNETNANFYDALDEAEMYANSYPENAEYQSAYKQYQSASSVLSYLYRQARENPDAEREYRMMAIAYAEEFLDGGIAQNDRLNEVYSKTGSASVYPYRKFEDTYTKTEEDEKGNKKKVEVKMTSEEFLEYVNTYNEAVDELYGEILGGIQNEEIVKKALESAKDEANKYAQTGELQNVMIAKEAGLSAAQYYEIKFTASTDGNSGIKKEEAVAALDKTNLTRKQKAVVFGLLGDWKSNPYKSTYY